MSGYRPDIDGLRAIAVTSVVGYHVGWPGMPGGFVGVDVFFVISGYLISLHLLDEVFATGTINLREFYGRRIRRLLPAFVVVALTTLALGAVMLLPILQEQARLAYSAIYAAVFLSNVEFARTGGYFDPATELKPLLHTWSLAVEEQFYLMWPLALLGLAALSRVFRIRLGGLVAGALGAACLASLAYGIAASRGDVWAAQKGFYLIWARIWELGIGAALALALRTVATRPDAPLAVKVLAVAGLVAIAAAITLYDAALPYPGIAAALPVLGAASVIGAGHIATTNASRLLSWRPVVFIGLVSYSWYLWHWPLLALFRSQAMGERDLLRDSLLAALALLLAVLTWRFIERPVRRRAEFRSRAGVLTIGVGGTCLVAVSAFALISWGAGSGGRDPRLAALVEAANDVNPLRQACNHGTRYKQLVPLSNCITPKASDARRIVLWGDSHADHMLPMLAEAGRGAGLAIAQRSMVGCPPALGTALVASGRIRTTCTEFNDAVIAEIRATDPSRLAAVVLAARWTVYLDRASLALGDAQARRSLRNIADPLADQAPLAVLTAGLEATLRSLRELGVPVIIVAPIPELTYAAPLCLARRDSAFCAIPRAANDRHRAPVLAAFDGIVSGRPGVRLFDPIDGLCDAVRCPAEKDGIVLYSDDDHLTASAARGLAQRFDGFARWINDTRVTRHDAKPGD